MIRHGQFVHGHGSTVLKWVKKKKVQWATKLSLAISGQTWHSDSVKEIVLMHDKWMRMTWASAWFGVSLQSEKQRRNARCSGCVSKCYPLKVYSKMCHIHNCSLVRRQTKGVLEKRRINTFCASIIHSVQRPGIKQSAPPNRWNLWKLLLKWVFMNREGLGL